MLPGPSWLPLIAGVGLALFFFAMTLKLTIPTVLFGALTLWALLRWTWIRIASVTTPGGDRSGHRSAGLDRRSAFARLVGHRSADPGRCDDLRVPRVLVLLSKEERAGRVAAAACAFRVRHRVAGDAGLARQQPRARVGKSPAKNAQHVGLSITVANCRRIVLGGTALLLSFRPQLAAGVDPAASAYGAIVWTHLAYQAFHTLVLLVIAAFVLARLAAKLMDVQHRAAWDNLRLLWHYAPHRVH